MESITNCSFMFQTLLDNTANAMKLLLRLHIFQLFCHSQEFGPVENFGDQLNFKSAGPEDQLYFSPYCLVQPLSHGVGQRKSNQIYSASDAPSLDFSYGARLVTVKQGWQKGGKYSYFPGRWEILVIPGKYW